MKTLQLKKLIVFLGLFISLMTLNNINVHAQNLNGKGNCNNPNSPNYPGDCVCLGIGCPIDDYVPYIVLGIVILGIVRIKSTKLNTTS